VPWLVPLLAISLIAWPMAATIEKMSVEKGKWIKSVHNVLPVLLLMLMILDRLIAVLSNDLSHSDIAKYSAGSNPINGAAWMTLLRGDGLSELVLMVLYLIA